MALQGGTEHLSEDFCSSGKLASSEECALWCSCPIPPAATSRCSLWEPVPEPSGGPDVSCRLLLAPRTDKAVLGSFAPHTVTWTSPLTLLNLSLLMGKMVTVTAKPLRECLRISDRKVASARGASTSPGCCFSNQLFNVGSLRTWVFYTSSKEWAPGSQHLPLWLSSQQSSNSGINYVPS